MNIYIVESPFQMLSAIEANSYFKDKENILVIKYSSGYSHHKTNSQLKLLKNLYLWSEIIEIDDNSEYINSNTKLISLIIKLKKKHKKITRVLIGEYRSWHMRQAFNILNPQSCLTLDDGNISIELAKSYISTGKDYPIEQTWKIATKRIIERFLLTILNKKRIKKRTDIIMFTCFNVDEFLRKEQFIKHSFDYLRSKSQNKIQLKDVVYFLGGNFSEMNVISEKIEINLLNNIQNFFKSRNIDMIYLPHRRESENKLSIIQNELKIKVRHSTYPVEIEFITMESTPQYLASFMSSALHTLLKIFTFDKVFAFQIPQEEINIIHKNDILSTYEGYRKNNKIIYFVAL